MHSGGRPSDPENLERARRAVALRAEGCSWRVTAEGAGYESVGAARAAVQRLWRDNPDLDPAELRREMIAELESMDMVLDRLENDEYVKVTPQGVPVVLVDEDGKAVPLLDPGPAFEAIRLRLAVQKRKAELFGTDAPRRTAADVTITPPELPEHLRHLVDPDVPGR
jgi:hypothetical protein